MRTDTISSSSHRELPKCGSRGFSRPRGARACIGILRPHPSPDGYSGSARARRRHPRPSACAKPAGSGSPSGHSRGRGAQSFCIDGRLATNERTNDWRTTDARRLDDERRRRRTRVDAWARARRDPITTPRRANLVVRTREPRTVDREPANLDARPTNPRATDTGRKQKTECARPMACAGRSLARQ